MDEFAVYFQDEPFLEPFDTASEAVEASGTWHPEAQKLKEGLHRPAPSGSEAEEAPQPAVPPIRAQFPEAGSAHLGGTSDGYVYRTVFRGRNLEHTYEMVREFLKEQGYADIPLPADADELLMFRLPTRNRQILLFEDNGYVHNPVKILFPTHSAHRRPRTLILELYNERAEKHLLRFHKKIDWPPPQGPADQ